MKNQAFAAAFGLLATTCWLGCNNETPVAQKDEVPSIALEKSWFMNVDDTKNLPPRGKGTAAETRISEGFFDATGKALSRFGFSWHFFADGTLAELRGQKFLAGKWAKGGTPEAIQLIFPFAGDETVLQKSLRVDSMLLEVGTGKTAASLSFSTDNARYARPDDHPFHPLNNLWRTKPAAAETDAQLVARLQNHVHHLALILDATVKNHLKTAYLRASPSCLSLSNGAVGLEPSSNWPSDWVDCFFNMDDAKKAATLLEKSMHANGRAATDAKKQWIENDLIILQNIEAGLKK